VTKTSMIRRSLTLPALATAVLGITACSGGVGDVTNTTTPSASVTSGNTGSPSGNASDPLASLDPCSLLTSEQVGQLGLTPQGPKTVASARGCSWAKGPTYVIGIHFIEGKGLDDPNDGTGQNTKISLPDHDAVETDKGSGCGVEIAITRTSFVFVQASEGGGPNECPISQQYATLIEPKLPAQQK
jgi:hypothetical protein